MKKKHYLSIVAAVALLASCTTTRETVSVNGFNNSLNSARVEMENAGYAPTGKSSEQKNELVVTGTSYSKYSGYGTLMENDFWTYDTYHYTDSANHTASYSVKYKISKDYNGNPYVNASVIDCNCSDGKKYDNICGNESTVKKIGTLPDQTSTFFDKTQTTLTVTIITCLATLVPLLFLL